MGLLDDAIREHLDLKRRRGGDPGEIERAEREALGPVRRGPEEPEQEPVAPAVEGEDENGYGYEPRPEWDERTAESDEEPAPGEHEASETELLEVPPAGHGGQETAEYDVEEELEPHREDPLEETPEFLQDTPEHDRLWFEQKPPKDFDFDG